MLKKVSFLILFTLLLVACEDAEKMNFVGKTKEWDVEFEVLVDDENPTGELEIQYIGENPIPEEITYLIQSPNGTISGTNFLNEEGIFTTIEENCSSCTSVDETTEMAILIEWEKQTELFTLQFE